MSCQWVEYRFRVRSSCNRSICFPKKRLRCSVRIPSNATTAKVALTPRSHIPVFFRLREHPGAQARRHDDRPGRLSASVRGRCHYQCHWQPGRLQCQWLRPSRAFTGTGRPGLLATARATPQSVPHAPAIRISPAPRSLTRCLRLLPPSAAALPLLVLASPRRGSSGVDVASGAGPARGPWTNLGRLPVRVFSVGKYAFPKKQGDVASPA
jgi:hypothetical protein